jgi:uracil-DNA glycosylase
MENTQFGYPKECNKCKDLPSCELKVSPYYKIGGSFKLMLIGQDPTIFKKPERVKQVLMLNEKNSQLTRWLRGIFGDNNFDDLTIYATNLVKCTFPNPPSTNDEGG